MDKMSLSSFTILYVLILATNYCRTAELLSGKNRCYSCASDNLKENFLKRRRGPPGRVREPRLYDSMCDLDTWLIREKSAIDCQGSCFKWQQVLNNSGVLSYATVRGCYERMFDPSIGGPSSTSPPSSSSPGAYTTECKHIRRPLECLDEYSDISESTCWCFGDFCNSALGKFGGRSFHGIWPIIISFFFCSIFTSFFIFG